MGTLVAHETIYMRQPGLLMMMPEIQSKSREIMARNGGRQPESGGGIGCRIGRKLAARKERPMMLPACSYSG